MEGDDSMKKVLVVGGGLAGMISAREIAKRGHDVTILEASGRLGGKAGADMKGGRLVEHGYHVFPAWYPNVRKLLDEVGVKLVDFDRYHYLRVGEFPKLVTTRGPKDFASTVYNLSHGLLPWYQTILFYSFTLELMSKSLDDKRLLDRVSQIGLMRQAWYITEEVAEMNQENLLKASAIPAYEMSAMTAKRIASYWIKQPSPFLSVLPGDLQTTYIEPIAKTVRDAGVHVELGKKVTAVNMHDGRVKSVSVDGEATAREADAFVIATPLEVTRGFIDGPLFVGDPSLGNIHDLEARPMSALHVRLKKKLAGIPREHVFFHDGAFGLSFIDVSQIWPPESGKPEEQNTVLSFIASNFAPLIGLSDADATKALMGEVMQYLPIEPDDVDGTPVLNSNVNVPLFINTIGAWGSRPEPRTKIKNLYIAGDYVQNKIDLACMEGAVSAAIYASSAFLSDHGEHDVPIPAVPPEWPRALLLLGRAALFPVRLTANLIARASTVFAPPAPLTETPLHEALHRRKHGRRGHRKARA